MIERVFVRFRHKFLVIFFSRVEKKKKRKEFRVVRFIGENERGKDAYVMNEVRASACSVSALSVTSR